MKKFCIALFATLLMMSLSSPAWAHGSASKTSNKNDSYQSMKERIHNMIVQFQFRVLKERYNHSYQDAQQLFLNYLGAAIPSADDQIQALREEYDQKIALLNDTVASYQQQIEEMSTQINEMNSVCDARLAQAQETWAAASQQQLNDLAAQKDADCELRLAQAYTEWQASVQPCQGSGPPALVSEWNTGNVSPYAIDSDGSGNVYVLDRDNLSVIEYNGTGTQTAQWNSNGFVDPVDLAIDSQGSVYVIDQLASAPIQKFGTDGTPMSFAAGSTSIFYPMGLFIDSNDIIYVTDMGGVNGGARVLRFDISGNLVGIIEEVSDPELAGYPYNDIVVDENNHIIYVVTDYAVASFTMDGNYLGFWEGDFRSARGIAVSAQGDIFIADTFNSEIDLYSSNGTLKLSFADNMYRPNRIFTDSTGKLYIADYRNMQVTIYE